MYQILKDDAHLLCPYSTWSAFALPVMEGGTVAHYWVFYHLGCHAVSGYYALPTVGRPCRYVTILGSGHRLLRAAWVLCTKNQKVSVYILWHFSYLFRGSTCNQYAMQPRCSSTCKFRTCVCVVHCRPSSISAAAQNRSERILDQLCLCGSSDQSPHSHTMYY